MSVSEQTGYLNIDNAHLRVEGNIVAENIELGNIQIGPTYGLASVTDVGNTTSQTVQFTNPTTGLVTTGNVAVGKDLTVSGNVTMSEELTVTGNVTVSGNVEVGGDMNLLHTANTVSLKVNSNVVTEFPRSKKLIKYPREAIPGNNSAVGSGYTFSASDGDYTIKVSSEYDHRFYASNTFDNNLSTNAWLSADSTAGYRYTSGNPITSDSLASSTFAKFGEYGEWIELKLPTSIYLGYVLVYPKDSRVDWKNTSAIVWGSNTGNDGDWQRLSTFTSFGNYSESNPAKIVIDSLISYNYYAYQITGINSTTTSQYSVVSELEYYGIPEYDPDAHGTDVVVKSVANVPNTDWLEVYYDAKDLADGAVTNVDDLTPSGTNDGTATNVTVSDGAFVFNGASSLLESSTTITNSTGDIPHTFSLWVKPSEGDLDDTGNHYLIVYGTELDTGKWSGISISNKRFASVIHASVIRFGPEVRLGEWYHIVLNYKSGGIHNSDRFDFFINGSRIDTSALSTAGSQAGSATLNLSSPAKLVLGGLFNGSERSSSTIANARLFNRVLTTDEIYQLYAYQKEYFGHGDLSMTLKAGRLGIGTSEPRATLDVRGDIIGGCPVFVSAWCSTQPGTNSDGTPKTIVWDKVTSSKGGGYDSSTGIFTAPLPGYYKFYYTARCRTTQGCWLRVYVNNAYIEGDFQYHTVYLSTNGMQAGNEIIVKLEQGHDFRVVFMTTSGQTSGIASNYNGFNGQYISSL